MADRPSLDDRLDRRLADYFEHELERAGSDFRLPIARAPSGRRMLRSSIAIAAAVVVIVSAVLVVTELSQRKLPGPLASPPPSAMPSPTSIPSATPSALGQTWTSLPLTGDLAAAAFADLVESNGTFIGVGTSGDRLAAAWTSPHGLSWTQHSLPGPAGIRAAATQIVVGPNGQLAFGWRMDTKGRTFPIVWDSPDGGVTWHEADLPTPQRPSGATDGYEPAIAASGSAGVVVLVRCLAETGGPACPASDYLWQSTDGIAWRLLAFPDQHAQLVSLVAAGPGFIAGGTQGSATKPAIWTSADGVSWSPAIDLPSGGAAANGETLSVDQILVGPDRITALSPHSGESVVARAWSSTDGRTWQLAADLTDHWFGLYSHPVWTSLGFLATGWVAPGVTPPNHPDPFLMEGHELLRSSDGLTWEVLPTPRLPQGDGIWIFSATADRIVAATKHAILVSPSTTPIASDPSSPGIPPEIDGIPVLRGADVRAHIAAATDASQFLVGGQIERFNPRCVPPDASGPPIETELLPPCGAGLVLADAGQPFITLVDAPDSLAPGPAVLRVHTHDPRSIGCRSEMQAKCEAALVVEAVVWSRP